MNKNLIPKTDILDIIFEKRNKAYGAYDLRKFYPGRLKLALGFMFIIAIAFSAFTLLPEKKKHVNERIYTIPEPKLKEIDIKPAEPVKKPETKEQVAKDQAPVNEKKYTDNISVVPDNIKTDTIKTLSETDLIGTKNIVTENTGPFLTEPVKTETGNGALGKITPKVDNTKPVDIDAVDVEPVYPGGMDALRKFLQKNLQNPYDLENGETVNVKVKFVVGYNGKLQSFTTVQDGGEIYNKEVMRVLKKMPDWMPGKIRGENVSVYYTIPVKFVMSN